MVGSGPNREESIGSQLQDHFLNLERRRDREVSVILLKLVGVSLEVGVTSLMKRILEAYSCRSTVCGGGYATNDGERLLQVLTLLLMTMGMTTIDLGQGLLPVSLFCMMRTVIVSGGVRVHLVKVWAMLL